MVLKKKDMIFKSVSQINKRIKKLETVKKNLVRKIKAKPSTDLQRSLRNVRESSSQLKRARRDWRKYITSIKIFTV